MSTQQRNISCIANFLTFFSYSIFSGKLHYTEIFDMMRNIDPPLGFGKKCPERQAYKKLIRMNMPMDKEGKVGIDTLLKINMSKETSKEKTYALFKQCARLLSRTLKTELF